MYKIMNILIGLDFILPLLFLGAIQFIPSIIFIGISVGLVLLRLIDVFLIYRYGDDQSQYQNSMKQVIVFYHHNQMQSFLIYLAAIIILCLIRILLLN